MSDSDANISGEKPVGISEVFRWTSWRIWAIFFGTAFVSGVVGAGFILAMKALDLRFAGILDFLIFAIPTVGVSYFVLIYVTNGLVTLLLNADVFDSDIVSRENLVAICVTRDDYLLLLIWICSMAVVLPLTANFLLAVAGLDPAIGDDPIGHIVIFLVLVLPRAGERVIRSILKRCSVPLRL